MIAPTPTPEALRQARKRLELTQDQAAAIVDTTRRSWAGWETGEREMPRALWTLFLMLTTERNSADAKN